MEIGSYDSCKLGLGSNHDDIYDWFPKYGKNMETARADVARLLAEEQDTDPPAEEQPTEPDAPAEQAKDEENDKTPDGSSQGKPDEKTIWDTLFSFIGNSYGTAGLMGNLYAESALKASNLQNTGNKALGLTDFHKGILESCHQFLLVLRQRSKNCFLKLLKLLMIIPRRDVFRGNVFASLQIFQNHSIASISGSLRHYESFLFSAVSLPLQRENWKRYPGKLSVCYQMALDTSY